MLFVYEHKVTQYIEERKQKHMFQQKFTIIVNLLRVSAVFWKLDSLIKQLVSFIYSAFIKATDTDVYSPNLS